MRSVMRKAMVFVVGLILTAAVTIIARLGESSQRSEDLMRKSVARETSQHKEIQRLLDLAAANEQRCDELASKIGTFQNKKASPTAPRAKPVSLVALMEVNSDLRMAWDNRVRARMRESWGPLFLAMRFSEEEKTAFIALLLEYSVRTGDVLQSAEVQGVSGSHPAIAELYAAELARLREVVVARFGEERFRKIHAFQRRMNTRQFVDGLAAGVAFTAPLSAAQADRLAQIIADATPSYIAGGFADNKAVDWAEVDGRARAVLSPAQFESWSQGGGRDPKGFRSRLETESEEVYRRVIEAEKRNAGDSGKPKN